MSIDSGRLTVYFGQEITRILPLNVPVVTIGRAPDCDLALPDHQVSRRHAEVRPRPEGPMLTDLASANGTFVGTTRLLANQPYPLADGTSFRIGPYTIAYQAEPTTTASGQETAEEAKGAAPSSVPMDELAAVAPGKMSSPAAIAAVPPVAVPVPPAPPAVARATLPAPLADGPASAYLQDLPAIYQDSDFLARFLLIFESLWEGLEQRQDHIDMYFDPSTCPAAFLTWLASWLDIAINPHWPERRRRRLLAEAMDIYRWRGTAYGLMRIIEVCAGLTPEITEDPARPFVFDVRVRTPRDGHVDRELIEDLIRTHKPAHAGYRLEITS